MKNRIGTVAIIGSIAFYALTAFSIEKNNDFYSGVKNSLSAYNFFEGNLSDLQPNQGVFPYDVNAPLFSDYAEKARFVYLPQEKSMVFRDFTAFEFPEGAVIIKNFYYPLDMAAPESGRKIIETRLLLKTESGWKALEYIWNEAQTDAFLEVAGGTQAVAWKDKQGKKTSLEYMIPNLNQCKGCHSYDGQFVPIGITARQLNRNNLTGQNQLALWTERGWIQGFDTTKLAATPALTDYRLSEADFKRHYPSELHEKNARARAYLDSNCAHCHHAHGPANTSGLLLDITQTEPEKLGVNKSPVAAGRGSGSRKYSIVPGKPSESILLFRMENDDPGIRMPEIGRQLAHREGIEIIKNWIRDMK